MSSLMTTFSDVLLYQVLPPAKGGSRKSIPSHHQSQFQEQCNALWVSPCWNPVDSRVKQGHSVSMKALLWNGLLPPAAMWSGEPLGLEPRGERCQKKDKMGPNHCSCEEINPPYLL